MTIKQLQRINNKLFPRKTIRQCGKEFLIVFKTTDLLNFYENNRT